jgi:hypothetical protein
VSAAAAAIVVREKRIVGAFRSVGATSAAAAVAPGAIGVAERVAFRRLRQRAVVREAQPGVFYVDEASWEALRAMRRRIATLAILALLVAAAFGMFGWLRLP